MRLINGIQLFIHIIVISADKKCSRYESRIARGIISEHFLQHYTDSHIAVPVSCPFEPARDMYLESERHKTHESHSKWACQYCGKAFISETTLDQHFDNRHDDKTYMGNNAVCLSDYCDFLRCDVVSGSKQSSYWDQALCKESEMKILKDKCENMVKTCGPMTLIGTARYDFQRTVKESLCSFLTCDKYWEVPLKEGSAFGMTAYIIAVVILFMGLIIYYYIVYSHFYSDHSFLDDSDGLLKLRQSNYYHEPYNQQIRKRQFER